MNGYRMRRVVAAMLVAGLLAGLTTSATAGAGGSDATVAKKKKKKRCKPGFKRVVIKKKNGKKKKKCVKLPAGTPGSGTTVGPGAALSISPSVYNYPGTQHNGAGANCVPCPSQTFVATNTGTAASGPATVSLQEVVNLIPGQPPAFYVIADSCSGVSVPVGGSCPVTVKFSPNDNPGGCGDCTNRSILHVIGSPGGDAQAALNGLVQG